MNGNFESRKNVTNPVKYESGDEQSESEFYHRESNW